MTPPPRCLPNSRSRARATRSRLPAWLLAALAMTAAAPAWAQGRSMVWLIGSENVVPAETGPTPAGPEAPASDLGASSVPPSGGGVLRAADALRRITSPRILLAHPTGELGPMPSDPSASEARPALQPLARVFGQQAFNQPARRPQRVAGSTAGVRADDLVSVLGRDLSAMSATDRGLIVMSGGHDVVGSTDLMMGEDTRVPLARLEAVAMQAPRQAPLRFVFTSCGSPEWLRVIRPGAQDGRHLSPYNRCAFATAAMPRHPGACEPAPGDHTSHFLAVLSGRDATGQPLPSTLSDLDGDRQRSLRDAHLAALMLGDDIRLPVASTEAYLERWQPLWLRYLDTTSEPRNEYGQLATELATRLRLPPRGRSLLVALQTRQAELEAQQQRIERRLAELDVEIGALQEQLKRGFLRRWPDAAHPHTAGYARFLAMDVQAAQTYLRSQIAYPDLVERQDRRSEMERDRLGLERQLTALDKVLRLRQLARLKEQFDRHASAQARRDFERLDRCERSPV